MKPLKYILIPSILVASPALAQSDRQGSGEITVIATGSPLELDLSGQAVSVIGLEEIERIQGPDLTRVLERLPGVTFTRNGGLGGFTGVRVRGANAEQLLVLIDGVRVADTAAPGGGFDFGHLLTGGVGRIELLRGSNSVIWGSEAIGGVIALTSRQIDGIAASVEYGARDTIHADASAGLVGDGHAITLSGGYTETDGVSSAAVGTEPDGYRQWRTSGRGRLEVADGIALVAAGRYADSRVELDGFSNQPPYGFVDTPEYSTSEEISGRAGVEFRRDRFEFDAGYAIYDVDRANYNPDFGSEPVFASSGRQERAELKGVWKPAGALRLDFGADHEWSRFSTNTDERHSAEISSGHALFGWYADRFTIAAGARLDDHSRFGSEWTFGANGSFDIAEGWRVRASYGEGFKAPTLYQFYSDYGNLALMPERSKSYDIGIEKGGRNNRLHVSFAAFRRDTRNLIDYVSCFGAADPLCDDGRFGFYDNVANARAQGIELAMAARVTERFEAQAAYSYVETENRTSGSPNEGNALARRPAHAVTVSADWATPLYGLELGGDIRMVGESYDDAGNVTRLDPYALVSLRANLPVTEVFEIYGRIENLTDEEYQTAAGYGTAGRSAFVGARARF